MKKVCRMVKEANFENSDGCCIVSISISPSNLRKISRIVGSRLITTTKIRGASKARSEENQS